MDVKLVVEKGPTRTRKIRLHSEETIIGRRQGCDLRIPSASVSRRHCLLRFRDGYLTVEDMESANGTFLNGERISGRQVVRPGDKLEIGPVIFVVEYQLTQAAIDHMMSGGEHFEVVGEAVEDVTELAEVEEVEELEAVEEVEEIAEAEAIDEVEEIKEVEAVVDAEPGVAPDRSTLQVEAKADDDTEPLDAEVLADMEGGGAWHLPEGEELRDILSQIDDPKPGGRKNG
jgi:pSer/pThr/pTyr-binding forkhead associated (FHA) protein